MFTAYPQNVGKNQNIRAANKPFEIVTSSNIDNGKNKNFGEEKLMRGLNIGNIYQSRTTYFPVSCLNI
jgi:hypothetical protein